MIAYQNIKRHDGIEFGEYLKLPGLSHSFLKGEKHGAAKEVLITEKIIVGKIVDAILSDPQGIDMSSPYYQTAKSIAFLIQNKFGSMIKQLKSQVSYTADIVHNSFVLSTKGRLDWQLGNLSTIDLKVTYSKDVKGLIKFMGYENQVWHYSKCSETKKAFIMIHSVPLKETFIFEIPVSTPSNLFWETKILKFGKPHEQIIL